MTFIEIKKNLENLALEIDKEKLRSSYSFSEAYSYMFGTTNLPHVIQSRPFKPSSYYTSPACDLYDEGYESCDYVTSKGRECIPPPKGLSLINYLYLLQECIYLGEKRLNWIKSLYSFLFFLREDLRLGDKKILETIRIFVAFSLFGS
jgi:hypothetical protein